MGVLRSPAMRECSALMFLPLERELSVGLVLLDSLEMAHIAQVH